MSEDFVDDMLETIGLGKILGTGNGTEEGFETINVEQLDDSGIEVTTGNIVLVLLEDFVGTFVGCSELCRQEVILGASDVEEDEITSLIDVLSSWVGGRDALEFVGVATLFGCGAE